MSDPWTRREVIGTATIYQGDCLEVMRALSDNSVDLIATDPPYFRVKGEAWDRQWDNAGLFIDWIGALADEWRRILRPNGSLYCFASPKMAARVEVEIGKRFCVLNHIVWNKPTGRSGQACKEALRSFFPDSERAIFAEHQNADNMAKGEAGYAAKCDELRGFVFEPLRDWFVSAWKASGLSRRDVDAACGCSNVTQYWFLERNYQIPTEERYRVLVSMAPQAFIREYEDLRRPFTVSASVPYTDVWDFPTVKPYRGKHVCEKPLAMMEHIVTASSRPGGVVLDCFMGSGVTGEAAIRNGRSFIGIEMSEEWVSRSSDRIGAAQNVLPLAAE